ncbi:MAG: hypothetical protein FJZ01_18360 [Candidatus Sericytochromatia bacterium]|nr:hypothetical protein [Candidatus Tanganyikabacteria bacterium]
MSGVQARITGARHAAASVVEIFDTLKSTRTGLDSIQDRVPPDGYLDPGEFPSKRYFDKIDRLGEPDGRISRDELKIAFARLPEDKSADVSRHAAAARSDLLAVGERARSAMLPFGVGVALAVAGLLLGGSLGLPLLVAGLAGVFAGMFRGFDAVVASGRIRQHLLEKLETVLAPVL